MNKIKVYIVFLSETKLNTKQPHKFQNYITYCSDNIARGGKASHGNTAVLVHQRIVYRPIILDTNIESTSIEIFIGPVPIRISAVYKPPVKP